MYSYFAKIPIFYGSQELGSIKYYFKTKIWQLKYQPLRWDGQRHGSQCAMYFSAFYSSRPCTLSTPLSTAGLCTTACCMATGHTPLRSLGFPCSLHRIRFLLLCECQSKTENEYRAQLKVPKAPPFPVFSPGQCGEEKQKQNKGRELQGPLTNLYTPSCQGKGGW